MKNRVFQKTMLLPLPSLMMEAALSLETHASVTLQNVTCQKNQLQYEVLITSHINTSSQCDRLSWTRVLSTRVS